MLSSYEAQQEAFFRLPYWRVHDQEPLLRSQSPYLGCSNVFFASDASLVPVTIGRQNSWKDKKRQGAKMRESANTFLLNIGRSLDRMHQLETKATQVSIFRSHEVLQWVKSGVRASCQLSAVMAQTQHVTDVSANMPPNTYTTASGVFRPAWRGARTSHAVVVRLPTVCMYLPQPVTGCLRSPLGTTQPTLSPAAFPPTDSSPSAFLLAVEMFAHSQIRQTRCLFPSSASCWNPSRCCHPHVLPAGANLHLSLRLPSSFSPPCLNWLCGPVSWLLGAELSTTAHRRCLGAGGLRTDLFLQMPQELNQPTLTVSLLQHPRDLLPPLRSPLSALTMTCTF